MEMVCVPVATEFIVRGVIPTKLLSRKTFAAGGVEDTDKAPVDVTGAPPERIAFTSDTVLGETVTVVVYTA